MTVFLIMAIGFSMGMAALFLAALTGAQDFHRQAGVQDNGRISGISSASFSEKGTLSALKSR